MQVALIFFKKCFLVLVACFVVLLVTKSIVLTVFCNLILTALFAKIYFAKHIALAWVQNKKMLAGSFCVVLGVNFLAILLCNALLG